MRSAAMILSLGTLLLLLMTTACSGKVKGPTPSSGGTDQGGTTPGVAGAAPVYEGEGSFTCPEYSDNEGFLTTRELTGSCPREGQVCQFIGPAICPPGSTQFPELHYRCECVDAAWSCVSNGSGHSVCG